MGVKIKPKTKPTNLSCLGWCYGLCSSCTPVRRTRISRHKPSRRVRLNGYRRNWDKISKQFSTTESVQVPKSTLGVLSVAATSTDMYHEPVVGQSRISRNKRAKQNLHKQARRKTSEYQEHVEQQRRARACFEGIKHGRKVHQPTKKHLKREHNLKNTRNRSHKLYTRNKK